MIRFFLCFIMIAGIVLPGKAQKHELNLFPKALKKQLRKMSCGREIKLESFHLPAHVARTDIKGNYFKISGKNCDLRAAYVFIGRVNTCNSTGCRLQVGKDGVQYEYFDFFTLYNNLGEVSKVKVFNYQATHGHEITSKKWLRQFENYGGSTDLRVGKEIDGITGATTSVHSISYEIQERTKRLGRAIEFYSAINIFYP